MNKTSLALRLKRILFCCAIFLTACPLVAQEKEQIAIGDETTKKIVNSPWEKVDVDSDAHFRGLHVVDDNVIWASGSSGTVIVSADGGETWRRRVIEGAEDLDFRDIHGFDDGSAVVISSGKVAKIFRTTNGGRTWKTCSEKSGAFYDSVSFWNDRYGIVMSDPIDGRFWLERTQDGGVTWRPVKELMRPMADSGEAGFAASGTNMWVVGDSTCFIGLGGTEENQSRTSSRILVSSDRGKTWDFGGPVPLVRSPSSGIFSVWFQDDLRGVAVGGDYLKPDDSSSNYAVTEDGGKTWTTPAPRVAPSGFRSCVAAWKNVREVKLIAVGTNGTDMSTDLGNKWTRISNKGFNTVDFSDSGQSGWGVGQDGSVARWVLRR